MGVEGLEPDPYRFDLRHTLRTVHATSILQPPRTLNVLRVGGSPPRVIHPRQKEIKFLRVAGPSDC